MEENEYEEFNPEEKESGVSWWIVGGILAFLFFSGWLGPRKYEGMTAEEWFNEYDYENGRFEDLEMEYNDFRDCVENYYYNPNDLYYNCL